MKGITLSRAHGGNPSLLQCPICGGDSAIALLGHLKGDKEAPRRMLDQEPCDKCREVMKAGIMVIEVSDGQEGPDPYRTGRVWGIKEETLLRNLNNPQLEEHVRSKRVCFMPESVAEQMGLPRAPEPTHKDG